MLPDLPPPSGPHLRRRFRPGVIALALTLLVSLTAASCSTDKSGVTVGQASRGTVDEIVEAPGSVTARAAATVSAPAAGILDELHVGPGAKVRKGDLLAVIDAPELMRRRRAAKQALEQSSRSGTPRVGTAAVAAERRKTDKQAARAYGDARDAAAEITDAKMRAVLLKQVDAAEAQYGAASAAADTALRSVQQGVASLGEAMGSLSAAQRLQAQQAYALADAAVDALTVRAPASGVVQLGGSSAGRTTSLGDLLSAGTTSAAASAAGAGNGLAGVDSAVPEGAYVAAGTPLVTIVDVTRLGLTAEVDETDVLLVKPGVTATVELDAAIGASYQATVRAVDLLPTTSARGGVSYRVRLDLAAGTYADGATAPTPRPGMSAVVRLEVREAADAVTVPASAIVNVDGRDTVWVVRDGRYRKVPVQVGVQGEDLVQVTAGVDAGERIVVAGADRVRAGNKVS